MILDFDDAVEEMGEKGFRIIGDCGSQAPKECFFIGKPAMSKPLLPAKTVDRNEKNNGIQRTGRPKRLKTIYFLGHQLSADFENYLSVKSYKIHETWKGSLGMPYTKDV